MRRESKLKIVDDLSPVSVGDIFWLHIDGVNVFYMITGQCKDEQGKEINGLYYYCELKTSDRYSKYGDALIWIPCKSDRSKSHYSTTKSGQTLTIPRTNQNGLESKDNVIEVVETDGHLSLPIEITKDSPILKLALERGAPYILKGDQSEICYAPRIESKENKKNMHMIGHSYQPHFLADPEPEIDYTVRVPKKTTETIRYGDIFWLHIEGANVFYMVTEYCSKPNTPVTIVELKTTERFKDGVDYLIWREDNNKGRSGFVVTETGKTMTIPRENKNLITFEGNTAILEDVNGYWEMVIEVTPDSLLVKTALERGAPITSLMIHGGKIRIPYLYGLDHHLSRETQSQKLRNLLYTGFPHFMGEDDDNPIEEFKNLA